MTSRNPIPERVWNRSANPWSGRTSLLAAPALLYAVYKRDLRLVCLTLLGTAASMVVFPERTEDADDWMTRGARAQQAWLDGDIDAEGLGAVMVASTAAWAYALYAAYRGPLAAAVASGVLGMATKVWLIDQLSHRDEERERDATTAE